MKRLVFMLLLLGVVLAQPAENIGHAIVTLQLSGYSPKPQSLYLPQNDARQSVDYGKLPVKHDGYGNAYLTIEGNYSFLFTVEVNASNPIVMEDRGFPLTNTNNGSNYLGETPYAQPNDPEIAQRALDVTRNSHSELHAITDLNLWVNSYLKYNNSYWGKIYPSTEALKKREGVCDEYANVYTAMARSLGMPTRLATGLVFTGSQWQRHAWAETLVGDTWVPADPTFSEVELVNALHIKLYHAPSYLFYQFPESIENINVLDYSISGYSTALEVNADVSPKTVPPRGKFKLVANITNHGNSILVPSYAAQKTVGIELLSDFHQSRLIHPNETVALEWNFVAPYGERDTYYIFLVGPKADEKYAVVVDPTRAAKDYGSLELKNIYAAVSNNGIVIDSEIKNRGGVNYASVVATVTMDLGTQQQSFSLLSGNSKSITFVFPAKPGSHSYELLVQAGNSSANTFGTVVVPQSHASVGVFEFVVSVFSAYSGWIYFAVAIIAFSVLVMVFLVPVHEGKKIPFKEREEWAKLMKLRKGE